MSTKRKITQNDLRKVMNEHKKKKLSATKKIESPLAKYTESGQIMCILCKSIIRSESAWPVHIVSSNHRNNVELTKRNKFEFTQVVKGPSPIIQSPKKSNNQDNNYNRIIEGIPKDFFDKVNETKSASSKKDITMKYTNEIISKGEDNKKEKDNSLPEGFFDDPILDARVRNVEYKNPMDDEWDRFQREIMEETAQSAQIIADDQEEATAERQLEEIDEQIHNWSRVMNLVKKKESVQREEKILNTSTDDISSSDEIEFNEEMDWRAKGSVK